MTSAISMATIRALDHLSLEVPAGCMVGLLGPDGVGKSTTFDLISGARKIQTGTVDVLGGDMRDARHRLATCPRIAYMPQGLGKNLDPTLSVFENVDFFGRLFGLGRQQRVAQIGGLLRGTGLERFSDRPAGKLSGGMKQKLGLCCSLIHEPGPRDPGRADDRRRPLVAGSVLGADRSDPRRSARHERHGRPPPIWTRPSGSIGSLQCLQAACSRPARQKS